MNLALAPSLSQLKQCLLPSVVTGLVILVRQIEIECLYMAKCTNHYNLPGKIFPADFNICAGGVCIALLEPGIVMAGLRIPAPPNTMEWNWGGRLSLGDRTLNIAPCFCRLNPPDGGGAVSDLRRDVTAKAFPL